MMMERTSADASHWFANQITRALPELRADDKRGSWRGDGVGLDCPDLDVQHVPPQVADHTRRRDSDGTAPQRWRPASLNQEGSPRSEGQEVTTIFPDSRAIQRGWRSIGCRISTP